MRRPFALIASAVLLMSALASVPAHASGIPTKLLNGVSWTGLRISVQDPNKGTGFAWAGPGVDAWLRTDEPEGSHAIAGALVQFLAGTRTVCLALTDAHGYASCNEVDELIAARSLILDGFTAVYPGDYQYLPSSHHEPVYYLN